MNIKTKLNIIGGAVAAVGIAVMVAWSPPSMESGRTPNWGVRNIVYANIASDPCDAFPDMSAIEDHEYGGQCGPTD